MARQAFALRHMFPDVKADLRHGGLRWEGDVQPQALSARYRLRLLARDSWMVTVFVVSPELQPNADGLLPHVYNDGSLCLNRFGEWSPDTLITDSLIPWACEWLVGYELWRVTDTWFGDGPDTYDLSSQAAALHRFSKPRDSSTN